VVVVVSAGFEEKLKPENGFFADGSVATCVDCCVDEGVGGAAVVELALKPNVGGVGFDVVDAEEPKENDGVEVVDEPKAKPLPNRLGVGGAEAEGFELQPEDRGYWGGSTIHVQLETVLRLPVIRLSWVNLEY